MRTIEIPTGTPTDLYTAEKGGQGGKRKGERGTGTQQAHAIQVWSGSKRKDGKAELDSG